MPTNLYGPGDNYHEAAMYYQPDPPLHKAKILVHPRDLPDSGSPLREFLHADDLGMPACMP